VPKGNDLNEFHTFFDEMVSKHKEFLLENHYEMDTLDTLYIGGGTPSLWGKAGAEYLRQLFLREQITLSESCEFTLEVNPGTWTEESITAWKELGVSRFSLGIQSLRADYLKILDRVHNVEDVFDTLTYFNKIGAAFSVDFMLGLPWSVSRERDILSELKEILSFEPEHLSLYILTAKGGYPHKKNLPEEDFLEEEYLKVAEYLKSIGYKHYEVSNFAKPGKESRHNLNYWKTSSVGALGPSAVGFLSDAKKRYKWKTSSAEFALEELDSEAMALERLYLGLRVDSGIEKSDHFSDEEKVALVPVFQRWQAEGLAKDSDDRVKLTSKGLLVLDGLVQQLFSYQK